MALNFESLSTYKLLELYRQLLLLRRFEEQVYFMYMQGEIPGTLHQYQGQEAVAVGVCDHLRKTDWITSTHRPHGHALAKGVTPHAAMAELYAKATGCCKGKGGSMHLGDPDVGMLPAIAIVGGGNSIVTGLGLAFKLKKTDQVAVCFFGDGATNEGAFHESMNFAAVQNLPILFVCENNLYGASTPYHRVSPIPNVADRVCAYNIQAEIVDGMDVLAVHEAAGRAIEQIRNESRPIFIECKTYRFIGHSRSDARGYRSKDEEQEWLEKDPIPRLGAVLLESGRVSPEDIDEIERQVSAEIDDAIAFARRSPLPAPEEAYMDIWA